MSDCRLLLQYDVDDGTPHVHFGANGLRGEVCFDGDRIQVFYLIDGKVTYVGPEITIPGLTYERRIPE